jgi:4-amino-4-deoxy-L-arabinose transferase-like glycosyltransferase
MNLEPTEAALPAAVAKVVSWRWTTLVMSALMLGWFVLVATLGSGMALRMAGLPILGDAERVFWDESMLDGAAFVFAICLGTILAARWLRPAATLPVALGVATAIVLGGAAITASLAALLTAIAMLALSWLLGHAVVTRLGLSGIRGWIDAVISIALGNGLLGLLLLLLATMHSLNAISVAAGALVLVLAIAALAWRRPTRIPRVAWRPPVPSWFETIIVGITCALVVFAMLAAFAPEYSNDAVRLHLPIAREFWQDGAAPYYADFWPTRYPIHAQILYAPVWGFGGMLGVKLAHTLIGLTSVAAVAGLGWMLAGRLAAIIAAAIFVTLPVVLWELGHAYVDFFHAMFIAAATLAALIWQRDGSRRWLVLCGALAAFAVAAKMTAGPYPVALALAIGLVGRERWRLSERVIDMLAVAVGSLVLLPWFLRSYVQTGIIPGLDLLAAALTGDPYENSENLGGFGVGRHPLDVLRIPWDATFNGGAYMENGAGALGIALLLTLPLIILVPRTRASALLLALTAIGFLGWAYTAQYFRYGLPLFACVAALCGAGISRAVTLRASGGRMPARVVPLVLAAALALTPLLWLPVWGRQVPVGLFNGRMTREEYFTEWVGGHAMLMKAGELVPANALLGWVSSEPAAQIYTDAQVHWLPNPSLGSSTQEVLDSLASRRISHFVWDRPSTSAEDWRADLLSTAFLRAHTKIMGAADSAYLFEIVDQPGDDWGTAAQNLLLDPRLEHVGEDGSWSWYSSRDAADAGRKLTGSDTIAQVVDVSPTGTYLFSVTSACDAPEARINLSLRWLDDHDVQLGMAWELVIPGSAPSEQFIWAEAPSRTARGVVAIAGWGADTCTVAQASLRRLGT